MVPGLSIISVWGLHFELVVSNDGTAFWSHGSYTHGASDFRQDEAFGHALSSMLEVLRQCFCYGNVV